MEDETPADFIKPFLVGFGAILFSIFLYAEFINPHVRVWQNSKTGEGELARAEFNRQIETCEANAKKESSKALADAEVIRAEGVAKANKIIGDSLANNEGYLRYLYITNLAESSNKTIVYIPTEGSLPILESTRMER